MKLNLICYSAAYWDKITPPPPVYSVAVPKFTPPVEGYMFMNINASNLHVTIDQIEEEDTSATNNELY